MPSSVVSTTSVSRPRIVRVICTTMISFSELITLSRVRRRTGRFLSGAANVYQRISPRCTELLPPVCVPRKHLVFGRELVESDWSIGVRRAIVAIFSGGAEGHLRESKTLLSRQSTDERPQLSSVRRRCHEGIIPRSRPPRPSIEAKSTFPGGFLHSRSARQARRIDSLPIAIPSRSPPRERRRIREGRCWSP